MSNFQKKLLGAIVVSAVLHTFYNSLLPLHQDEAYYWLWSKYPDWSYYDHPAMVAWLIKIFSFLGNSEVAVRFTTVFCMSISLYCLSMLAYTITKNSLSSSNAEKAGWYTFAACSVVPATTMFYLIITPDSPLIMFWSVALYTGYLAISDNSLKFYLMTGFSIALMIVSKYTAIFFPLSLFFYMIVFNRRLFRNKYVWIACFIGMTGVFPILMWNMQHDWISVKFQYGHGTSGTFKILWQEFLILIGGLQLIPMPVFAFLIYKTAFNVKRLRKEMWWQYLFSLFIVSAAFFLYKGLFKKMELNWPVIAFISAMPLFCIYVADGFFVKTFKVGLYSSAVITLLLAASPFLSLPDNINISLRMAGIKDAVVAAQKYIKEDDAVFSDHLTSASMTVYYLKDHPRVYIPTLTRYSQFNIWDENVDFKNMHGIYIGKDREEELRTIFKNVQLLEAVPTGSKTKPKMYYIYRVG